LGKGKIDSGTMRTNVPKKAKWFAHRGVSPSSKNLHRHPSHPYPHAEGRRHRFPPTSRIKDRKGKQFRQTPQELRQTKVEGTYEERTGQRQQWD